MFFFVSKKNFLIEDEQRKNLRRKLILRLKICEKSGWRWWWRLKNLIIFLSFIINASEIGCWLYWPTN